MEPTGGCLRALCLLVLPESCGLLRKGRLMPYFEVSRTCLIKKGICGIMPERRPVGVFRPPLPLSEEVSAEAEMEFVTRANPPSPPPSPSLPLSSPLPPSIRSRRNDG
jgi:hypothetical protein